MIILPAVEQWANAYTFSTTNTDSSDDPESYSNFIVMVCHTDKISGLLFDGQVLFSREDKLTDGHNVLLFRIL